MRSAGRCVCMALGAWSDSRFRLSLDAACGSCRSPSRSLCAMTDAWAGKRATSSHAAMCSFVAVSSSIVIGQRPTPTHGGAGDGRRSRRKSLCRKSCPDVQRINEGKGPWLV